MIYRYFYENTGEIVAKAQFQGTLDNPGKCMVVYSDTFIDTDQDVNPDQYLVDLTTNTLVAKSQ